MSVYGYEFTRPNGEKVIVYAPVFAEKVDAPASGSYTSDEMIALYGESFDLRTTMFCWTATTEQNLRNNGFANVILNSDYSGETWTLSNGNYLRFTTSNYSPTMYIAPSGSGTFGLGDGASQGVTLAVVQGYESAGNYARQGVLHRVTSSRVEVSGYGYVHPASDIDFVTSFYKGVDPIDPNDDPYSNGGESGTGGGTGDFDGKSDSIDIPDLPTASATDAGFITLFNPSLSQMKSLAAYMWSDLFDLDGWRKLFANPMDAILGLSIVPVAVPSGGAKEVKVGNIGTGVSMTTASTQYVAVDCGTLNVNEYWGAYLDYEPFTKAEIYLPYIGTHAIAVDDIMGKAVHVVYHVDILSGACCAYVKCGASVLYTFIGQCSSSIPITGDNWTNVVNGVLNIAGSIGSMVATGGASAPLALGEIASTSVNAMKPSVEKSGSMSGTGGMMAIQTPYLILTRPRQAVPKNQNKYTGYPSYITKKLSSLKGYTEVESIHIEGVYATDSEMSELYNLLASGVIF